jgi:hypothetical protein
VLGDRHLHIDKGDTVADLLGKALNAARSGTITIDVAGEPAVKMTASSGEIAVDLLQPTMFQIPEDETGLFDKLRTASEFGRKLSDNGVTLYFLRRGKEAVRLGKGARPTFSKLITRSGDIQMSSVKEFARLKGDLKTD